MTGVPKVGVLVWGFLGFGFVWFFLFLFLVGFFCFVFLKASSIHSPCQVPGHMLHCTLTIRASSSGLRKPKGEEEESGADFLQERAVPYTHIPVTHSTCWK